MNELLGRASGLFAEATWHRKARRLRWIAKDVSERIQELKEYTSEDINLRSFRLQKQLTEHPREAANFILEAFVLASLAAKKILGYYPNATQLTAAMFLAEGKIVELRSGEGKTLVAMLAAYWLALQGRHIDIATTNDYLAERDQRWMGMAYAILGMNTGVVTSKTPRHARRREYEKHVTYVANQELGFDYLNDNLILNPQDSVLGALDFVIIDEVDSILIDEARTSLIITEPKRERIARSALEAMQLFARIVEELEANSDYEVDYRDRSVALTDAGVEKVTERLGENFFDEGNMLNKRTLWYALYARAFIEPGKDYIVANNRITLVDEFTGHVLPDRVLLEGLQQAVEVRAGLEPSGEFTTIADITYRNFFKLYSGVAGMTGTAADAREEFANLYGLDVALLEPHRHVLRKDLPTRFFRTEEEKMVQVVAEIKLAREQGYPILLVARSIATAERVSSRLKSYSLPHRLLHAALGEQEPEIIEAAGKPGAVTVATNMAGRGTDIILEESLRYKYGLDVLGLEHNLSRRVDEQLRGRAGRQGQFGKTHFFASLEDELFQMYGDDAFWDYAEGLAWPFGGLTNTRLEEGVTRAQEIAEANAAESRFSLARFDSLIDHHRNATYTLRRALLNAAAPLEVVEDAIRRILCEEKESAIAPKELGKLIAQELPAGEMREHWLALFLREKPRAKKPIPQGTVASETKTSGEGRKALLRLLDLEWQNYLEQMHWLEDWIGLTAAAGRDPFLEFVESADRMFHDMRKTFALAALRSILKMK